MPPSPPVEQTELDAHSPPQSPESQHRSNPPYNSNNRDSLDTIKHRIRRSHTARTYQPKLRGRQWQPGLEPGIDPGGAFPAQTALDLVGRCEVSVVDFSEHDMQVEYLDNGTLGRFLNAGRPEGMTCRWINVNGLSWDVISMLGRKFGLHRLAIEDVLNRSNRTKADWYQNHMFSQKPARRCWYTIVLMRAQSFCRSTS